MMLIYLNERRKLFRTDILCPLTAGCERTPGGQMGDIGRQAGYLVKLFALFVGRVGNTSKQTLRIRVCGCCKQLSGRCLLKHLAGVHHDYLFGHARDNTEIVRDQDDTRAHSRFEVFDEFEDLGLDGDVQSCRRFVGDEQFGIAAQCHRDHHTLTHASRELVRVSVDPRFGIGYADRLEHVDGVLVRLRACYGRGGAG